LGKREATKKEEGMQALCHIFSFLTRKLEMMNPKEVQANLKVFVNNSSLVDKLLFDKKGPNTFGIKTSLVSLQK
jgi:hypothetical protein